MSILCREKNVVSDQWKRRIAFGCRGTTPWLCPEGPTCSGTVCKRVPAGVGITSKLQLRIALLVLDAYRTHARIKSSVITGRNGSVLVGASRTLSALSDVK